MSQALGPYLEIRDHELWIEDLPVASVAEEHGTPLFVTSENTVRANYRTFYETFSSRYAGRVQVCVGMKANWGLALRKVIVQEGGGGDAFGLGELYAALLAGSDPEKIVMNGNNKSDEVLAAALETGVHVNVDDLQELDRVSRLSTTLNRRARISLRIRLPLRSLEGRRFVDPRYKPPGIDVSKWEREFKFGMEPETLMHALERALKEERVDLLGLHYHGGIPRRAGYSQEETEELMEWVAEFKRRFQWEPRTLNLGGGFPKDRFGLENPHPLEKHAEAITGAIRKKARELGLSLPDLILEPGRWCWEDATLYVNRVGSIKVDETLAHKKWVYVDGSINEMGDPFDPFRGYHHVVLVHRADAPDTHEADICGPLCNAADILASQRRIPDIASGDLIAFLNMGAYNEAFANQANAMPRSASVLVNGSRSAVIRRRETLQDLFSRDRVPFWLL